MLAVGAIPLELGVLGASVAPAQGGGRGGGRGGAVEPLPPLGPPPALPDKASFPNIRGTSLNAAATHPRPVGAADFVRRALLTEAGDGDGFRPSEARIIQHFAKLINADPSEVTLVPTTQAGESLVAAALGVHEKGAHVVSDYLHFVGSQMAYTDMANRGVDVTWVKIRPDGSISLDDMDNAIRKGRTKLVAVSATSMVNGFQHDLERLCEIAHAKGAMVFADAIQAVGNQPIDVKASGVDAISAGTYKWLMSAGTAFLYVRRESLARMQPPIYHWTQESTPLPTTHMYPFDEPGRQIVSDYTLKPGTQGIFAMGYEPNVGTLAGLEYSLPYIMNIGVAAIQSHAQAIVDHLKRELPRRGYPLLTPLNSTSPIVSVAVENASRLNQPLRDANVIVTTRWNHVRIAPSVFNTIEDAERLIAALPT
jgi:selenocysteine lyase/cysteine desulfurase